MAMRITRILSAYVVLVLLASVQPALGDWSPLHPLSFNSKDEAKTKQQVAAKKEPSAWDKLTSGTKNFFDRTGEMLGLKKPEAKKQYTTAMPRPRTVQRSKKEETKSWWNPLASPEPEGPKTVPEWMMKKRLDP